MSSKKNPIKLRVTITEDSNMPVFGNKKYSVEKWVFERKSGMTLEHGIHGTGYSLKEARGIKKMIEETYLG